MLLPVLPPLAVPPFWACLPVREPTEFWPPLLFCATWAPPLDDVPLLPPLFLPPVALAPWPTCLRPVSNRPPCPPEPCFVPPDPPPLWAVLPLRCWPACPAPVPC